MSKKSTPELLGDEEFLRQHHLIEISVGARQVSRLARIDDKNSHDKPATSGELFNAGFFYGADELLVDIGKAGFPEYPARATMAELEKIAERYVGEAPDIKDPRNLRASYAWVLAHFAEAEYYRQKFMSERDFIELWGTGVLMGRLVEWWLWRTEGHDRMAAGKASSERALNKARVQRAIDQEFDADWRQAAQSEARTLYAKNSKRSRWNIAEELAPKYGKSTRHVWNILKLFVP